MRLARIVHQYPIIMIVIGVIGISFSSIFVKFSDAPSSVIAALRLIWTVFLMTPAAFSRSSRKEFSELSKRNLILSIVSGLFLAAHFVLWFESLKHTSVASSTTIVCTEVIWVSIGFCILLKGRLPIKAWNMIGITFLGSVLIALFDHSSGSGNLYGDFLALLAAVAVAVYVLIGRIVRDAVSTTVYTYVVYSSCALALLIITFLQRVSLFDFGAVTIVVGLLLAVFSTILGHSVFSWCLKYFSPSYVSASKLCEPVVAAILAYFFIWRISQCDPIDWRRDDSLWSLLLVKA